jgi:hypothetical protein
MILYSLTSGQPLHEIVLHGTRFVSNIASNGSIGDVVRWLFVGRSGGQPPSYVKRDALYKDFDIPIYDSILTIKDGIILYHYTFHSIQAVHVIFSSPYLLTWYAIAGWMNS